MYNDDEPWAVAGRGVHSLVHQRGERRERAHLHTHRSRCVSVDFRPVLASRLSNRYADTYVQRLTLTRCCFRLFFSACRWIIVLKKYCGQRSEWVVVFPRLCTLQHLFLHCRRRERTHLHTSSTRTGLCGPLRGKPVMYISTARLENTKRGCREFCRVPLREI